MNENTQLLLSKEGNEILQSFLLCREHDIAIDWEDFGGLRDIFIEIFTREPKEAKA